MMLRLLMPVVEDFKKDVPPPPAVYRGTSLIHTIEILARENSRRVPFMDGNKIIKGIGLLFEIFNQLNTFALTFEISSATNS